MMRYPLFGFLPYGFFLAGSLLSQAVAVYFAYSVFKVLRGPPMGGGDYEMGGGGRYGYSQPEASAPPRQSFEDSRHEQTRPGGAAGGGGFVPFAGSGNRLGS